MAAPVAFLPIRTAKQLQLLILQHGLQRDITTGIKAQRGVEREVLKLQRLPIAMQPIESERQVPSYWVNDLATDAMVVQISLTGLKNPCLQVLTFTRQVQTLPGMRLSVLNNLT